ncbi:Glycerophosphoryl diester phosphodiesterase [Rhodovulum sp. P5]|uniref:glycerophosphodiester phosphodiesterase family protein n=1 Tax=Rhodovulum sp. P5 TaxID=1564506 RepID=UPI0009C1D54D|nr:glycerophosphodiester phosphodiesterase family protein [Rhodovulum sp. P5]ARE40287.1 Glycerophosphoryl diester phosphodiesterase [Rhodovulum sp. P5]
MPRFIPAAATLAICGLTAPCAIAATVSWQTLSGDAPIVIGHRGAAAYLPEDTIGGNELAATMGAQYVETDVQLTRDGQLVVMHDETLDRTTNVEDLFAPRNGGYAVADFDLAEIQMLTAEPTGLASDTYPGFTPRAADPYRVPSLAEMLDALNAYNLATGSDVGILVEVKGAYSEEANKLAVETLIEKGFTSGAMPGSVQSFNLENVEEMAGLIAAAGADIDLFQLGGAGYAYGQWFVGPAVDDLRPLSLLATYVDGIAILDSYISEELIEAAHGYGLEVYGWTFRPADEADADTMTAPYLAWGLDGFITDNTDLILAAISSYGIAAVPLPATLPMALAGMAGFGLAARRRRKG